MARRKRQVSYLFFCTLTSPVQAEQLLLGGRSNIHVCFAISLTLRLFRSLIWAKPNRPTFVCVASIFYLKELGNEPGRSRSTLAKHNGLDVLPVEVRRGGGPQRYQVKRKETRRQAVGKAVLQHALRAGMCTTGTRFSAVLEIACGSQKNVVSRYLCWPLVENAYVYWKPPCFRNLRVAP